MKKNEFVALLQVIASASVDGVSAKQKEVLIRTHLGGATPVSDMAMAGASGIPSEVQFPMEWTRSSKGKAYNRPRKMFALTVDSSSLCGSVRPGTQFGDTVIHYIIFKVRSASRRMGPMVESDLFSIRPREYKDIDIRYSLGPGKSREGMLSLPR